MCRLSRNALQFTALYLWGNLTMFLYNKQNNTWMLGNMKLFLVLNRISWSTLEIDFILTHNRVWRFLFYTLWSRFMIRGHFTLISYKRSVLRRQSRDTNRNIKRSVHCKYGWYSLTFRALALRQKETAMFSLTKDQCSKR